jgi:hypothetical protein
VLGAILSCRTAALGGHLYRCERCERERPVYNSCRNRHCPKCQALASARWVEARPFLGDYICRHWNEPTATHLPLSPRPLVGERLDYFLFWSQNKRIEHGARWTRLPSFVVFAFRCGGTNPPLADLDGLLAAP